MASGYIETSYASVGNTSCFNHKRSSSVWKYSSKPYTDREKPRCSYFSTRRNQRIFQRIPGHDDKDTHCYVGQSDFELCRQEIYVWYRCLVRYLEVMKKACVKMFSTCN